MSEKIQYEHYTQANIDRLKEAENINDEINFKALSTEELTDVVTKEEIAKIHDAVDEALYEDDAITLLKLQVKILEQSQELFTERINELESLVIRLAACFRED